MGVFLYLEYILSSFPHKYITMLEKRTLSFMALSSHAKNSSLELILSIYKNWFCQPDSN